MRYADATAVIGLDGPEPELRAAWRDRHIASITAMAAAGVLLLGLPLHSAEGRSLGSLMIVAGHDPSGYLAAEPFAVAGVWRTTRCRRLRIPALPWSPWPRAGAPLPAARGHSIIFVKGEADPARLGDAAASGMLVFAAATMDEPGAILVTTHGDDDAARGWLAADPRLRTCPAEIYATRFRPLPYLPMNDAG
jgi:uncharacterized protein YciI